MAMGGLGLSLAGFAGLLAAFHRGGERQPEIYRWRMSVIVLGSLFVLFLGFGVVPIYGLVDDVDAAVRITTALAVLLHVVGQIRFGGPGPAWPDEQRRRIVRAAVFAQWAIVSLNLVFASITFLQFIFLWLLFSPISVFYNAVRDVAAAAGSQTPEAPGTE